MYSEPVPRSDSADSQPLSAPPQFRLRTLLLIVAAFGVLFAVMQAVGLYSSLALLFFLSLIALHVMGNALGTRLRDEATRRAQAAGAPADPPPTPGDLPAESKASQLTEHRKMPRRLLGIATVGAVIGGIAGGGLITAVTWQHITVPGIVLGVVSSAVLGGFAGFLASSFYTVARGAFKEAVGNPPPSGTPP